MAANNPNSPRQRMINLMYLVFIAMLALNVSSEVLDGFDLVEEGLQQTIKSTEGQNKILLSRLQELHEHNPVKSEIWYQKSTAFRQQSDSIFSHIQDLKVQIVKKSDGKNGNVNDIKNKEDLNSASEIMLSPTNPNGKKLRSIIEAYRGLAVSLAGDSLKGVIEDRLSTMPSKSAKRENKNWEEALFEQMPTAAAVTLLTKLQTDVRAVQGEVLTELMRNIGADDYKVNSLEALVVPKSMIVMQGGSFEGQVILAAVDTTKRPNIYIGNTLLPNDRNGIFQIPAGGVGTDKLFTGRIELERPGKGKIEIPFSSKYTVVEPMATIAPRLMNVLYAGIDNQIDISVPGISLDRISAQVTNGNGKLERKGNYWVARPSKVGQDVVISVTARVGDRNIEAAKKQFRVRALPDPTPYIEYTDAGGAPKMFKGGKIAKATIVGASGIKAAIDDGVLNIPFTVLRFSTVFFDGMGNALREVSNGAGFSERQQDQIRRLSRGKSCFVTDIRVKGPDGIERDITALEIRIN